ncbi:MAG: NADPH-dependent F420 reductase [Methanotrichaceae archaeon]
MKIALVGGTGDIGTGFAVRWSAAHEIIIGSRKSEKALESVKEVQAILGGARNIWGTDNGGAIKAADIVVLCIPYEHLISVTSDIKASYSDQVVVSPVVPMSYNGKYFGYNPPPEGCAALQAKALLPEGMRIVSAFHTICAAALHNRDLALNGDALICGDDKESKDIVAGLARAIKDLRPLDVGPLAVSAQVESLTPMLLNVAKRNKLKNTGVKIVEEK